MQSSNGDAKFLEPWYPIESNNEMFERELYNEICKDHILYGKKVKAIARRHDCDDVLFLLLNLEPKVAVVHLTYSISKEMDPSWPRTKIYGDIQKWAIESMMPQHRELIETEGDNY